MFDTMNNVSMLLLSAATEETFEEHLLESMELIGKSMNADCVELWPNEMRGDTLHFVLKYKWLSATGKKAPPAEIGTAVAYPPNWLDMFLRGDYLNGLVKDLPEDEQALLTPLGITSTLTVPLFYKDKFWGVFCVDDCIKERSFADVEVGILRSAGLLLMNALQKNSYSTELREVHNRTQLLLDTTPLAVNFWNRNLELFDCNNEAVRLFKVSDKEEYRRRFFELSPEYQPDGVLSRDKAYACINKAFDEGICVFEWMHQASDGTPLPSEITLFRVAYESDFAVAGYSRDLREQKRMLQELESAQMTTSAMFEASPQINILFDSGFNAIDCNPAAVEFMGFNSKDELLTCVIDRIAEIIPLRQPDGSSSIRLRESLIAAQKNGFKKFDTEILMDGIQRSVNVEFRRIPYEGNFAIVCYITDLTEVRARERELIRTREQNEIQLAKLNLVLNATKIGLWDMEVTASDPLNVDNPIAWSNSFRHLLGFDNTDDFPDVIASFEDRLHPEDSDATHAALKAHLFDRTGQTPFDVEYRLQRKNGDYAYFRSTGETIRDANGAPIRVAGALVDITEAKNILLDTERQRIEAEAANKAKSSFLSAMSHEIRTPMNAIVGITEILLQNDDLDQEIREALDRIYVSGDLLMGIINNILDLSKIEAGKLELAVATYETASMLSETAQLNMMRIGSKAIEFELVAEENLPYCLKGDELHVKQILNNLLSNAYKYTQEGIVRLSAYSEEIEGNDREKILVLCVSDTGQGMSEESVSHLFDEYVRFNLETNRLTEGTGLGMSITRNLVSLMKGEISIESKLNKGTTVTVRIPQGTAGARVLGPEMVENLCMLKPNSKAHFERTHLSREPMPYGKVLVVDDVETNLYVARGMLLPYELSIETVTSGFEAVKRINDGKVYDIIFMDHMMPKMDGVAATKIIRQSGYKSPIVALTANAVAGEAERFLSNGFDDYLSKPIDGRHLNAVLHKFIVKKQLPETIEAARRDSLARQKKAVPVVASDEMPTDPQLERMFLHDAESALETLEALCQDSENCDEEALRSFVICMHGMKSALASIGRVGLSSLASKLEIAGREGKLDVLRAETPGFIDSLRVFVEELKPEEDTTDRADENPSLLLEQLHVIKTACKRYDNISVQAALEKLERGAWSRSTRDLQYRIRRHLLHSDFDEIADLISCRY